MSNYSKSTNFATKDNLSPGNPLKIVKGTEIDTEFNNIATAIATKTDNSSATITGGTINGAVIGGTTAAGRGARGAVETVRPFTEAGREVIAGNVLRQLSAQPEAAITSALAYKPTISGYRPTTAQATRDVGLVAAETPIRALDVTGKFAAQATHSLLIHIQMEDAHLQLKQELKLIQYQYYHQYSTTNAVTCLHSILGVVHGILAADHRNLRRAEVF